MGPPERRDRSRDDEFDEDPDDLPPDLEPAWFAGQHLPEDARRMGLDHRVPDGALLDFAGRLDASKPRHKLTAWVILAVLVVPLLMAIARALTLLAQ